MCEPPDVRVEHERLLMEEVSGHQLAHSNQGLLLEGIRLTQMFELVAPSNWLLKNKHDQLYWPVGYTSLSIPNAQRMNVLQALLTGSGSLA